MTVMKQTRANNILQLPWANTKTGHCKSHLSLFPRLLATYLGMITWFLFSPPISLRCSRSFAHFLRESANHFPSNQMNSRRRQCHLRCDIALWWPNACPSAPISSHTRDRYHFQTLPRRIKTQNPKPFTVKRGWEQPRFLSWIYIYFFAFEGRFFFLMKCQENRLCLGFQVSY